MKINITKNEYENLLHVLYMADWIMHGFEIEERNDTQEYRKLEQKFLSYASEYGLDELVDFDPRKGVYYPSQKLDNSPAQGFIEEYEEELFWDEFVERLAKRDLVKKYGPEVMKRLFSDEDIFNEFEDMKEKYATEFETFGLERLHVE